MAHNPRTSAVKKSLSSLSFVALTLLAATGHAAPADSEEPIAPPVAASGSGDANDAAACDTVLLDAEQNPDFDEIVFATYPELVGRGVIEALQSGNLAETIALSLNSDGDELVLDLGGELYLPVPELPVLSLGGEVELEASLSRHVLPTGETVYELKGDADLLGAGQASVGIAGGAVGGAEAASVMWRFSSPVELAQAVQALAVRAALGPHVGPAIGDLNRQIAAVDRALAPLRTVRAHFVGWLARFLPSSVIQRLEALNRSRQNLVRAVTRVNELRTALTRDEQSFAERPTYVELELGVERSRSLGAKLLEAGGQGAGTIGIEWEGRLAPSISVLATVRGGVPEDAEVTLHIKNTQSVNAGVLASLAVNVETELEVSGKGIFTTSGFEIEEASDVVELSVDRGYSPAAWAVVGAQYAAGRRTSAFTYLSELYSLGTAGIEALTSGDPSLSAGLLAQLPVSFEGQARIERGGYVGLTLQAGQSWSSAGLHAAFFWTDQGTTSSFEGPPSVAELAPLFTMGEAEQRIQDSIDLLNAVAVELGTDPLL